MWRSAGLTFCLGLAMGGLGIWLAQDWRYGRQLAEQEQELVQQRLDQAQALNDLLLTEREQRRSLEQRLHDNESKHFQELTDAQLSQARLRDRLATADLRLSVLVERDASCSDMLATSTPGGLDHGPVRARLDPAHAGRIIAITNEGDQGLIALKACQAYINSVLTP